MRTAGEQGGQRANDIASSHRKLNCHHFNSGSSIDRKHVDLASTPVYSIRDKRVTH